MLYLSARTLPLLSSATRSFAVAYRYFSQLFRSAPVHCLSIAHAAFPFRRCAVLLFAYAFRAHLCLCSRRFSVPTQVDALPCLALPCLASPCLRDPLLSRGRSHPRNSYALFCLQSRSASEHRVSLATQVVRLPFLCRSRPCLSMPMPIISLLRRCFCPKSPLRSRPYVV